jgi:hypothetical protein
MLVTAVCPLPRNAWTLIDFEVTTWPAIGLNMKPGVCCLYNCNVRPTMCWGSTQKPRMAIEITADDGLYRESAIDKNRTKTEMKSPRVAFFSFYFIVCRLPSSRHL